VALISVFSLQSGVSGRLSDSGDAQVVSVNLEKDVQGASEITTDSTSNPLPCGLSGSSTQVLSLQWGSGQTGLQQTEVSYVEVPSGSVSPITYSLDRNVCQIGSTTPVSSSVVSSNVPSGQTAQVTCGSTLTAALTGGAPSGTSLSVSPLPAAVTSGDTIDVGLGAATLAFKAQGAQSSGLTKLAVATAQTPSATYNAGTSVVDTSWATTNCGANAGWISTSSVTGVTFAVLQGGLSNYSYTLVAVPRQSSPQSAQPTVSPNANSGCGFATPGTGTYASLLCFVDFTDWGTQTAATGLTWSCNATGTPAGALAMSAPIADTPYTLSFCISASSKDSSGNAVTGSITGTRDGEGPTVYKGYNDLLAVPMPTYYDAPVSEAFLGNNGFYTGVPGDPALYTADNGSTAIVTITQIQVTDSNGNPASGWTLVTGDAESTDSNNESLTFTTGTSGPNLNLLPNSSTSQMGNACPDSSGNGGGDLTGIGTQTVKCWAGVSTDKTGTLMLGAKEPSSLTVTLVAGGLQAMFLGVLLPS
jgi:hypothetical protein